jgi:DNA-binding NarL/FixJ family response regulator
MKLGARGAVLKSASSDVLLEAIRCVDRGEYWVSSEIVGCLIESIKEKERSGRGGNARGKFGLTARENEMVTAVLEGYSNPQIATRFGLSEQTVKNHLSHVFDKVGVYSRVELALFAVNHRIASDSKVPALPIV